MPRARKRRAPEESHDEPPPGNDSQTVNQPSVGEVPRFHPSAQQLEEFGIVLRDFYPPEMSNERCHAYTNGTLLRPIEELQQAYEETQDERRSVEPHRAVVHWFKSDLRLEDNRALQLASQVAQEHKIPLICLYILSPEDLTAHLCSPARVDFTLRNLRVLKEVLGERDIPLYMETQDKRQAIPGRIVELCQQWGANHIFANLEYEVDELRREARLIRRCARQGIKFEAVHDTCVVTPGALASQQGNQYAVYTPWYRAWCTFLRQNPENLEVIDAPASNPAGARKQLAADLFASEVPPAPSNKTLSDEEKKRFRTLYPEGEESALERLQKFLDSAGRQYADNRNYMEKQATSVLSPYLAAGVLSARTAVSRAQAANRHQLTGANAGLSTWISEVAWRDFYRHVLVHWPFICMNKCFKPEFTNVEWEYDEETFCAWSEGRTGYPLVDAAMRQLRHCAWMHNRPRMVVSSFLAKDLLIDWRRGERFFMEHLVDGDFASNHGGWGFGSSTGVDPQPYFRIFNPVLQSERFDRDGEYIRRWVPELRDVKGAAIHDPYHRGAEAIAAKQGYPRPIVDHSASRGRALARYKRALQ
ncbi:hypothetical protein ASPZODRAFT_133763 [Penicilliopsis zonata CBS 506.65]|uniref:Photolyase/cryptochrome alpha/beta domain-containing protein n=1 Tax=Penicilliopsis zonata CBS 506.65 TaxID=1073090 RepID=A0A1L9SFB6_9EURO|nr:hypothetical protein ASPZODRAFT_133763 [Penicilliopsis zonata CBS 506.65]OJJ45891.1 hypothetical protein ASPZODRAFT_133763 [Penicilliopsis zonata CBS 506.65]